jgi:hypothetical protein
MAKERILDAEALINGSRWSFAYYVAGYAVECALKSCVLAQMIHTGGVFKNKRFSEECFTHNFEKLVDLAGLTADLNADLAAGAMAGGAFVGNWTLCCCGRKPADTSRRRRPKPDRFTPRLPTRRMGCCDG